MRLSGSVSIIIAFLVLLCPPGHCGGIGRATDLGDDFQRQMPYSGERPQSGETPGQPQPQDYVAPPERESNQPSAQPQGGDYPLCYNPYTRLYENCYPQDSDYWRQRYSSPEFRYWWDHGHACPSGYYFRSGWGCYRH